MDVSLYDRQASAIWTGTLGHCATAAMSVRQFIRELVVPGAALNLSVTMAAEKIAEAILGG